MLIQYRIVYQVCFAMFCSMQPMDAATRQVARTVGICLVLITPIAEWQKGVHAAKVGSTNTLLFRSVVKEQTHSNASNSKNSMWVDKPQKSRNQTFKSPGDVFHEVNDDEKYQSTKISLDRFRKLKATSAALGANLTTNGHVHSTPQHPAEFTPGHLSDCLANDATVEVSASNVNLLYVQSGQALRSGKKLKCRLRLKAGKGKLWIVKYCRASFQFAYLTVLMCNGDLMQHKI